MAVDFIKDYLPWAPPLLTLVGWYLVNAQNNGREQRKEVRAAADRCKSLAREAAQSASNYWQGQANTPAWQVKAVLEELEVEIKRFPKGKGRDELVEKFVDLIDAIAADDFESANMRKKQIADPIMQSIARSKQSFLHEVENQFGRHFQ